MTNTVPENIAAAAVAAANWWADAIGSPRFDNGDHSRTGEFTQMLATLRAVQQPVPTGAPVKFTEALARRIVARADIIEQYGMTLGVDYGPDPELADAAREAGIGTGRFPWKTVMWINADHVTVSAGYRAPTVLVWGSEAWLTDRPLCHEQQYDETKYNTDTKYGGEPWRCSLPKYHDERHLYDAPLALCDRCGHPESFWHDEERSGYAKDFHGFVAPIEAAS